MTSIDALPRGRSVSLSPLGDAAGRVVDLERQAGRDAVILAEVDRELAGVGADQHRAVGAGDHLVAAEPRPPLGGELLEVLQHLVTLGDRLFGRVLHLLDGLAKAEGQLIDGLAGALLDLRQLLVDLLGAGNRLLLGLLGGADLLVLGRDLLLRGLLGPRQVLAEVGELARQRVALILELVDLAQRLADGGGQVRGAQAVVGAGVDRGQRVVDLLGGGGHVAAAGDAVGEVLVPHQDVVEHVAALRGGLELGHPRAGQVRLAGDVVVLVAQRVEPPQGVVLPGVGARWR